jgi:antitoxin VbhA-like protein
MTAIDAQVTPAVTAAGGRKLRVVANPSESRTLTVAERERAAANALASTRAEGLDPAEVQPLLAAWARGEIDTDQMVAAGLEIADGGQQQSGAPPQAA